MEALNTVVIHDWSVPLLLKFNKKKTNIKVIMKIMNLVTRDLGAFFPF